MVYPYKTPNETREVNEDIQQDPDYSDWGPVAAQVNYFGLIPYLIKSFQELHEEFQTTRTQLEEDLQTTRTQLEGDLQATRTQLGEDLQTTRTQFEDDLQTARTQLEAEKTENEITRLKLANAENRISILEQSLSSIISKLNI